MKFATMTELREAMARRPSPDRRSELEYAGQFAGRGQLPERTRGPGADALDDVGGAERSQPHAVRQVGAAREARKAARGEIIAGAGRIDKTLDFRGGSLKTCLALDRDRLLFPSA